MSINVVTIEGNITRDVESRAMPDGKTVAQFGIAYNWKKDAPAEFFDVTVFGPSADYAAQNAVKGRRVMVQGRLHQRSWEDKAGQKRTSVGIVAGRMSFWPPRQNGGSAPAQVPPPPAMASTPEMSSDDIPF